MNRIDYTTKFLLALLIVGVWGLLLRRPFGLSFAPWTFFRYLSVLIPPSTILLAVAAWGMIRTSRLIGITILLALLLTDSLHHAALSGLGAPPRMQARDRFPSLGRVSFPLLSYVYELCHPWNIPEWVVARYLRERARPQDMVLATYGDLPLQFYTDLKVVGGLQGGALPRDPDWMVLRSFIVSYSPGKDADVVRFIRGQVDISRYQVVPLPCQDSKLETNPEPEFHLFRPPADSPRLFFLRRRRDFQTGLGPAGRGRSSGKRGCARCPSGCRSLGPRRGRGHPRSGHCLTPAQVPLSRWGGGAASRATVAWETSFSVRPCRSTTRCRPGEVSPR